MLKNTFGKISSSLRFLFRRKLQISSNIINVEIKDHKYLVDKNDVKRYNNVVKNNNSQSILVENKENIHPLFYTKISWQILKNLTEFLKEPIDDRILKTIVHQSEYITFHDELILPTSLTVKSKIFSIRPHKKGTKMMIKFDYYSDNKLVATEYSGGLLFGIKCIGDAKTVRKFPVTERINETAIWKNKIEINKLLPYIYAEKADIDAPIHTNPKFAKSIGLPDIILQGTCTFAKAINLVLSEEFKGKPYKIKSVSAKFTGIIVVPNNITVRLLKKEEKIIKFDVHNNSGKYVIKGGEIVLA